MLYSPLIKPSMFMAGADDAIAPDGDDGETVPIFARALPPQPTEIAPGTKPPALIVIDDEPTTMTTTRKLAYAGTGLGLLAALAALLWYLGAF